MYGFVNVLENAKIHFFVHTVIGFFAKAHMVINSILTTECWRSPKGSGFPLYLFFVPQKRMPLQSLTQMFAKVSLGL